MSLPSIILAERIFGHATFCWEHAVYYPFMVAPERFGYGCAFGCCPYESAQRIMGVPEGVPESGKTRGGGGTGTAERGQSVNADYVLNLGFLVVIICVGEICGHLALG